MKKVVCIKDYKEVKNLKRANEHSKKIEELAERYVERKFESGWKINEKSLYILSTVTESAEALRNSFYDWEKFKLNNDDLIYEFYKLIRLGYIFNNKYEYYPTFKKIVTQNRINYLERLLLNPRECK